MFVYIKSEPGLWTVGHYAPSGEWEPESDHSVEAEAAERTAWLNGSSKPTTAPLKDEWLSMWRICIVGMVYNAAAQGHDFDLFFWFLTVVAAVGAVAAYRAK